MKSRWKIFAGVAITAMALSACSAPTDDGMPTDATLVVGMTYAPKTLNPNYVNDPANYFIMDNIYSRLVNYGYDYQVHGDLADDWEISDDGLTYTFTLVDGASWSDGEAVTSADVLWTAESLIEEQGYGAAALAGVADVTAPDESTVVMTLDSPNSSFLNQLAQRYGWVILPEHVYAGTDPLTNPANDAPVGSGPFIVSNFTPGEAVELVANENYYGGTPRLSSLAFRFFPSVDSAVAAMRTGEIQFMANAPSSAALETLSAVDGITVDSVNAAPPTDVWLGFNMQREPLDDIRVRTAVSMAINADQINELVYGGTKNATGAVFNSTANGYDASIQQPAFDVEAANDLLDEAGHPRGADGVRFGLTYTGFVASLGGADQIGEVLKQQLAEVGIDLTLEYDEFSVFAEKIMQNGDFDITWSGGPHGPDPQVYRNYVGTDGNRNAMRYSNPRVDELFDLARATTDVDEQNEYYAEIQQIIADDLPRYTLFSWSYEFPYASQYTGFWWQDEAAGAVPADSYLLVGLAD